MSRARTSALAALLLMAAASQPGLVAAPQPGAPPDALAAEVQRWSAFVRDNTDAGELWTQVKPSAGPALERASQALTDGRRLLALQRLLAAREMLAAAQYVGRQAASTGADVAAFEAEWRRLGSTLGAPVPSGGSPATAALAPALHRALAEAALSQAKVYYDASLEYGRNTMPESGLFYLGTAQAQRSLIDLLRTLAPAAPAARPAATGLRSLARELDALEAELLAAYRPPASIDRHPAFISASAALKEARELDAAGLRHGALLRYLQAAQRVAPLRQTPPPARDAALLEARLAEWRGTLNAANTDHTIARLFLEEAESAAAHPGSAASPLAPSIIVDEVLPKYLALLAPAPAAAPKPEAAVTVTLVRWPYT